MKKLLGYSTYEGLRDLTTAPVCAGQHRTSYTDTDHYKVYMGRHRLALDWCRPKYVWAGAPGVNAVAADRSLDRIYLLIFSISIKILFHRIFQLIIILNFRWQSGLLMLSSLKGNFL